MPHYVITVTLCYNFLLHFLIIIECTETQDPERETLDLESRIQKPGLRNHDPRFEIQDPGTKTKNSGLRSQNEETRPRT